MQSRTVEKDIKESQITGLEQGTFYAIQVVGLVGTEENLYQSPSGEDSTTTSK